jgi:hypothetical protein
MMAMLAIAIQAAAVLAAPAPVPPQDWSGLPVLAYAKAPDGAAVSGFVAAEVTAGRCRAASVSPAGATLAVDAAVLVAPDGLARKVVPRAIDCPAVEQYAAGLISSTVRANAATNSPVAVAGEGWYRTTLTFSWKP